MEGGLALKALGLLVVALTMGLEAEDEGYEAEREAMVRYQIEVRGIKDRRVLKAMRRVPRHLFVPPEYRDAAYEDRPLPIGEGQTISQPYIVALMTESLGLTGRERVLEIGTGSGYQAAVLAELAREIYTVEIVPSLAARARELLERLGCENVHVRSGDGFFGWPEAAPFDAVILTCAAPRVPERPLQQLKDGGRMVLPLGEDPFFQSLVLITKKGEGFEQRPITGVVFVPMTGEIERRRGP